MPYDVQDLVTAPRVERHPRRFQRTSRRREAPFARNEAALAQHEAAFAQPTAAPAQPVAEGPDWVRIGAWTAGLVFSIAAWVGIIVAIVFLAG